MLVSTASQAAIAIDNAQLHEVALQRRTLERDLELAREVQRAFLPTSTPDLAVTISTITTAPPTRSAAITTTTFALPDGRLAVIVADVVGHGVAAAMLMAKLSAEARFSLAGVPSPAQAMTALNERICSLNLHRFVTCIMVVLDPALHQVTVANAGHMAPLRRSSAASCASRARRKGVRRWAFSRRCSYGQVTFTLEPGESLVLYTDGINEAMDPDGQCFSIDRLRQLVAAGDGTPETTGQTILESVRGHMGRASQEDDMCLVILRRLA